MINQVNSENILEFLFDLISKDLIDEKKEIKYYLKGYEINNDEIVVKEIDESLFVAQIRLSNDKYLLIEDYPLNFIISYGILIGDLSQIVEFSFEDKKYVCLKSVYEKIQFKFKNGKNIKIDNYVEAESLNNLDFFLNYKEPKIISKIQFELLKNKNLDLKKTRLVSSDIICNFVPNVRKSHLKLAEKFEMDLKPLIKNSVIVDTKIHFNNTQLMRKKINPIFESEINTNAYFDSDFNRLYLDISKDYYLKYDFELISKKINNLETSNFNKERVLKEIGRNKMIKISSDYSYDLNEFSIKLPIWKARENFIKIKNKNDFKNLTGVEFHSISDNLEDVYIQDEKGVIGEFENKFLSLDVVKIINSKTTDTIFFKTKRELILKLIFFSNIKNVYFRDDNEELGKY